MQPIIQRYMIETRQTVRFGMGENDIPRTTLILAGPGTKIPNLASLFENQLEFAVEMYTNADAPWAAAARAACPAPSACSACWSEPNVPTR